MSKRRRLFGLLLVLALIFVLVIAACGGDDDDDKKDDEDTQQTEQVDEGDAETAEGEGDAETAEGEGDAETAEGEGDAEMAEGEGDAEMVEGEGDAETAEGEGDAEMAEGEGDMAPVSDLGIVTVGMNAEYPPFEFVDEDGEIAGFDAALVAALAEAGGFEYELVNTKWDGIFVALASGEFDMVASAATITAEREEIVNFSLPYFYANQRIAVLEANAEDIQSVEDLAGLKVGVQAGTTGDIFASEEVPGAEVVRYEEITLAFQALANGDVDAILNDGPTSQDIISKNPDLAAVLVGPELSEEFYGIAIQPDNPELLDAVNAALQQIAADGTYAVIYEEWFDQAPSDTLLGVIASGEMPEVAPAAEETEGEGDAEAAEGEGDAEATEGEGDAEATEGEGDAEATEGEGDAETAEGEGDAEAAEGEGDMAPVSDLGIVTVGMNAEYPPFEYVDEDGEIAGFDAALVAALAEAGGFEIELVNTKWDGIFVALASGEFDMVASAATITAEREEVVNFSLPYFYASQRIAVREADAETITTVEDLAGLRIGVQAGTTGDIFASEEVPGAEVVRYEEITLAFQALASGDVDAIMNDGPTSSDIISKNPDLGAVLVGEPLSEEFYGIAVQPDNPELLDAVNAALQQIAADGTYAAIYEEWFDQAPSDTLLGVIASGEMPEIAPAAEEAEGEGDAEDAEGDAEDAEGDAEMAEGEGDAEDAEMEVMSVEGTAKVTVTVREAPEFSAEALGTVALGDTLAITGVTEDGKYYQVEFEGAMGYAYAAFVAVEGDVPVLAE